MRALTSGSFATMSFFLMLCCTARAQDTFSLAETDLRPGAVPRLQIATGAETRHIALYARTAGGAVYALPWLQRGEGAKMRPLLEIGPGRALEVRVGKGAGYFVAPRAGIEGDREALILLSSNRPLPEMGALAPAAGRVPDIETAPGAGGFFRALAAAPWRGETRIHILAYRIDGDPRPETEPLHVKLQPEAAGARTALLLADLLAVEMRAPARRVLLVDGADAPVLLLEVAHGTERDSFLAQLPPLLRDLGIVAAEIDIAGEESPMRVGAADP